MTAGTADARKDSREELHRRRGEVVALHLAQMPVMQIVQRTGLSWAAVRKAIDLYGGGGEQALRPNARGPKAGTGRKLTNEQEAAARRFIRSRSPWYYGLKDRLWTRDAVARLLKQKFGVTLTGHGLGNYLKRWGLAVGPAKHPIDRCTAPISDWLGKHRAELEQSAIREVAEIYWVNRPSKLDRTMWGHLAAKARKVVARDDSSAQGPQRSIASVSNSQGRLMWMIINARTFNAEQQQKFLNALALDSDRRVIYLIRCDATVFRSETLQAPPNTTGKFFPELQAGRPVSSFASEALERREMPSGGGVVKGGN